MKQVCLMLFAWWFLMAGPSGGFSSDVYTTVGPFKDQQTCNRIADWAKKQSAKGSECWEG